MGRVSLLGLPLGRPGGGSARYPQCGATYANYKHEEHRCHDRAQYRFVSHQLHLSFFPRAAVPDALPVCTSTRVAAPELALSASFYIPILRNVCRSPKKVIRKWSGTFAAGDNTLIHRSA